jgi:hypothetical protein
MSVKTRRFVEEVASKSAAVPKDYTGAATTSGYLSLKEHETIVFFITTGAWAGGDAAVTLTQATDSSGTGAKALEFDKYWLGGLADVMVETAVTSDTFNISDPNKRIAIQVSASDIVGSGGTDVANNFDYVQLNIASPGANADLYSVVALGFNSALMTTPDKMAAM